MEVYIHDIEGNAEICHDTGLIKKTSRFGIREERASNEPSSLKLPEISAQLKNIRS